MRRIGTSIGGACRSPGENDGEGGVALVSLNQMLSKRSYVSDRDHELTHDFPLHRQVVLIGIRGLKIVKHRILQSELWFGAGREGQRVRKRRRRLRAQQPNRLPLGRIAVEHIEELVEQDLVV